MNSPTAPVQVELIGRVQRQTLDNRYYTCICYVKVLGTPVYGFLPSESQHSPSTALQISSCDSRESCQTHDSSSQHDGCKQLEERQSPASSCGESIMAKDTTAEQHTSLASTNGLSW